MTSPADSKTARAVAPRRGRRPKSFLADTHPEIAAQYRHDLNDIPLDEVSTGSGQPAWWQAPCGHAPWQAKVHTRTSRGRGCPTCSGHRVEQGVNDLATLFPGIAAEWAYDLNELSPTEVSANSAKRIWWRAACGHDAWDAPVYRRTREGTGCRLCGGRKSSSHRTKQTFLVETRPEIAAEFVTDLNPYISLETLNTSSDKQVWWQSTCGHSPWQMTPYDRSRKGYNCPTCSGRRVAVGVNDLASLHPDIAIEWAYHLNGGATPQEITANSNRTIWWRGTCGHSPWPAKSRHRIVSRTGCPTCSNHRVEVGVNDLRTTHPTLAAEWADDLNGALSPQDVPAGRSKGVWWRCALDHEPWRTSPSSRSVAGRGCPTCAAETTSWVEEQLFVGISPFLIDAHHGRKLPVPWGKVKTASVDIVGTADGRPIVIEYDGEYWHRNKFDKDTEKTEALLGAGYLVIRVRSDGLPHLTLSHPRLLQLDFTQRFGRGNPSGTQADLAPVISAIDTWLQGKDSAVAA